MAGCVFIVYFKCCKLRALAVNSIFVDAWSDMYYLSELIRVYTNRFLSSLWELVEFWFDCQILETSGRVE